MYLKDKSSPNYELPATQFITMMESITINTFKVKHLSLLLCLCFQTGIAQQEWRNPLEFPLYLAGNCGELRPNHFHGGIDMKTQGVIGKAVHAVQKGYVSRISVSPWGYGNALYLTHPDGTTTVYGHLERFAPKIADYLWEQQHQLERFAVNLYLTPEQLPVEEDEIVAYSGNTGSSGGPHVHFEIRDTETEELIDPLPYYMHLIKDTRPPKITGLMIYPQAGKGVVNGKADKQELKIAYDAQGKPFIQARIEAWGDIGLAIRANDYMNETGNIYGVKETILQEGGEVLFRAYINRFGFDENRYINSLTDYEVWSKRRTFYMKCFVEPGNRLRFIESRNRGILSINEEKEYPLSFILKDAYGNQTQMKLTVIGKKQPIPEIDTEGSELFHWYSTNLFGAKGIRLKIPRGNLYTDLYFRYRSREEAGRLADVHILHNKPVALHQSANLSLRILKDTIENKSQYGIVQWKGQRRSWIGGTYRNGWIDTKIKELGTYTISADTIAPKITPLSESQWKAKKTFTFRLTDNLSGVDTYKGTIDGQFVLFRMNNKSVITCQWNKEKLLQGEHQLKLVVTDACGNKTEYNYRFKN